MRLWKLLFGWLAIGLISPGYAGIVSDVSGMYSEPAAPMIMWAMLPALGFIYTLVVLYYE